MSLKKAAKLAPDNFAVLNDLGSHLAKSGYLSEGKKWLMKALVLIEEGKAKVTDAELLTFYTNLGSVLSLLMETDEGLKYLTRAQKIDPNEYVCLSPFSFSILLSHSSHSCLVSPSREPLRC